MNTTPEHRAELRRQLSCVAIGDRQVYGPSMIERLLDDVEELQERATRAETLLREAGHLMHIWAPRTTLDRMSDRIEAHLKEMP